MVSYKYKTNWITMNILNILFNMGPTVVHNFFSGFFWFLAETSLNVCNMIKISNFLLIIGYSDNKIDILQSFHRPCTQHHSSGWQDWWNCNALIKCDQFFEIYVIFQLYFWLNNWQLAQILLENCRISKLFIPN